MILQFVQFVLGYPPLQAGLAFTPMAVMMMMMGLSPRVSRLLARFGPGRVAPAGLLLMAGGFVVFSAAGLGSSYWRLPIGLLLLGRVDAQARGSGHS